MPVRFIYLVRHGQYESYPENGDPLGGGLTPLGQQRASLTAEALAQVAVTAIHTSTLRRAAETAGAIAARLDNVPVQPWRDLWEIIPCIPAREADYFALHFPSLTGDIIQRDRRGADHAYERLFCPSDNGQDQHTVIVCHGNLIRYFACRVLGVPVETWANMETNNCGITRVTVEADGRQMLLSLNDVGHLPVDMRTFM